MTILTHTLGFPRVGLRRELKKAQESYWAGNSTREALLAVGRELRARHWEQQKQAGIDLLPVGDFGLVRPCSDHQPAVRQCAGSSSEQRRFRGHRHSVPHWPRSARQPANRRRRRK
ncbi:5-methyltetrahydropteroyltriglutamate--homocysteine S-methyltransferase [Salmonella enterica subsp. enterica]|nr:5-methyltetrahydropteroyltriglutamate--homocysteine S-methyltransferase [Salmonella enterica subsp. enterica]